MWKLGSNKISELALARGWHDYSSKTLANPASAKNIEPKVFSLWVFRQGIPDWPMSPRALPGGEGVRFSKASGHARLVGAEQMDL